jgi:hypothetical protein
MTQIQTRTAPHRGQVRGRRGAVSLAAGALVLLGAGGAAAADAAGDGYVNLGAHGTYGSPGYALTTDSTNWRTELGHLVGTVRLRVAPDRGAPPIFAGVADPEAVQGYLTGVRYATIHSGTERTDHGGTAAPPPPATLPWTATAAGSGTQTLQWPATAGDQVLVVMNADGSPGVRGRVESVAVTIRGIGWIAAGLLAAGAALSAAAVARFRRGVRAR